MEWTNLRLKIPDVALAAGMLITVVMMAHVGAAIPSASGRIDACAASKTGVLRAIDTEAGQACAVKEKPLSWSLRAGSGPKAYGLVQWTEDLNGNPIAADVDESRSFGLTDSMVTLQPQSGTGGYFFCFDVPFEVDNISVTAAEVGKMMAARFGVCGEGAGDFTVRAWSPSAQQDVVTSFFIVLL